MRTRHDVHKSVSVLSDDDRENIRNNNAFAKILMPLIKGSGIISGVAYGNTADVAVKCAKSMTSEYINASIYEPWLKEPGIYSVSFKVEIPLHETSK